MGCYQYNMVALNVFDLANWVVIFADTKSLSNGLNIHRACTSHNVDAAPRDTLEIMGGIP